MFRWHGIRRAALAVLAALGLMGLTAGGALAAPAADVQGTGRIWASGSGYARLAGSGEVRINRGFGEVRIRNAEEVIATGRGQRETLRDGTVRIWGWDGEVTVRGKDMTVEILGARIGFTAAGRGTVLLKGRGVYKTASGQGTWRAAGAQVRFGQ